jgi:phosphotransacetylase
MRNITITCIDKEENVNEYFTDKLVTGAENVNDYFTDKLVTGAEHVNDYFTDKLVTGAETVNAYFTDKLVTGAEHITIITYCYSGYRDRKCTYNLPSNHFLCERELQVTFK